MALEGVRFTSHYPGFTVCSPSRASCLTGRSPLRYRCMSWGHDLPLREVTIAEAGRAAKDRALGVIAAQEDGRGIGRIRMRSIPNDPRASLLGFIEDSVEPGSVVIPMVGRDTGAWRRRDTNMR